MTTPRDPDRLIRAFLAEGQTDLPDRTYDAVRADIDRTRQRVVIGPWREPRMNNLAKLAIAIAAVAVVAVVGYNLLPGTGGVGGGPSPTPSPAPTPAPTPSPATALTFPARGELAVGRHSMTLNGVRLSINVAAPGWTSNGSWGLDKGNVGPGGAGFILWPDAIPDRVYSDPCGQVEGPPAGPATADLAAAVAALPGSVLVSGPSDVTVGGKPAKLVVITIPEDAPCPGGENGFYLWGHKTDARYATELGETFRVWIIDVDGTLVWIDGETYKGGGPEVGAELEQIVNSIQFE
ncbi:MAG: hypothetical protein AABZ33_08355 [Chloroflexota bacterium]